MYASRAKKIPFTPFSAKKGFSRSGVALAVMMAVAASVQAADLEITSDNGKAYYKHYSGDFDNVTIDMTKTTLSWDRIFDVKGGTTATVNGNWTSNVTVTPSAGSTIGAETTAGSYGGTINILGNIDAVQKINAPNLTTGGSNVFWIQDGGTITLGSDGTSTKIWSIGTKPDAISSKRGSTVTVNSTSNQIVGSMDMIGEVSTKDLDKSALSDEIMNSGYVNIFAVGMAAMGGLDAAKQELINELGVFIEDYKDDTRSGHAAADQLAGNILGLVKDPFDKAMGVGSEITATFDGAQSYWFGDEQNGSNAYLEVGAETSSDFQSSHPEVGDLIKKGIEEDVLQGKNFNPESGANFNLTLKNGAQWTYFGIADNLSTDSLDKKLTLGITGADMGLTGRLASFGLSIADVSVKVRSIPKRVSALTLQDGGIVNLYDEDIKAKWKEIGLDTVFPEVMEVKHDYVRIGNLQGNGGIFRLDLNSTNKAESDMIFVESGSGTFSFEPYNPALLTNIKGGVDGETLRFATVAAGASVTFKDKVNIQGQSLKDYELYVKDVPYSVDDAENSVYEAKVYADEEKFGTEGGMTGKTTADGRTVYTFNAAEDFKDGTNWIIYRVVEKDNENVTRLNANPEAGWDYARTLDRLHHRLGEIRYSDPTEKGLWARARYERLDQHQVNLDRTMVQVGADFRNTERNRVGLAFDYNWGDADFDHVKGQNDITGYNLMFYDTWLKENGAWVDLTASIGRMKTESDAVLNNGQSVTADYSQTV